MKTSFLKSRRPERGISLIEVLVSMGVLAIGLLGVAALFPVGAHYIRQGAVSDQANAIAASALSDAIARGMLDPERWLAVRPVQPNASRISLTDRPFASFLRGRLAERSQRLNNPDPAVRGAAIAEVNRFAGSIFVIDPLGIAEAMNPAPSVASGQLAELMGFFPAAVNPQATFNNNTNASREPNWLPWNGFTSGLVHPDPFPGGPSVGLVETWPVRRLSVVTGALPVPARPVAPLIQQAEEMVVADDDLAIELEDYTGNRFDHTDDSPSQQRLEQSAGRPLGRLARGEFSWFLTVVPTTPEARDGLAFNGESFSYDVSAVVSYKRASVGGVFGGPAAGVAPFGHDQAVAGERTMRASIATTGIGGGQIRVFNDSGAELASSITAESPLENLEEGQWVMLFGPHPDSTATRPLLFSQWYQVLAREDDNATATSLFLSGPDWPWQPLTNTVDATLGIQNDLRLIIAPDVVAVHTRTLKIEPGAAWGID